MRAPMHAQPPPPHIRRTLRICGGVLLVLGVMHFFNLYIFSRVRRRARLEHAPPPVQPSHRVDPVKV